MFLKDLQAINKNKTMRKLYKNFLTKEEAESLINDRIGYSATKKIKQVDNPIIEKVINKLIEDFNCKIKDESYVNIETTRPTGHGWHLDTGRSEKIPVGHMEWCQVGATLLLQEAEDGGGSTYYADDHKETNKVKVNRALYDLCAHTSDEWHMVEGTSGGRIVLLLFI
tara:strand:- start:296 stop:799 length:504 start_codon:yes stop_codon:yes gene_type:complete